MGLSSSAAMNSGEELLREEDLHSWFLDPDITQRSRDPRSPRQWRTAARQPRRHMGVASRGGHRHPEPVARVGHVRTYTDLATMEGANEAARRAVNGLLDAVELRRRPLRIVASART